MLVGTKISMYQEKRHMYRSLSFAPIGTACFRVCLILSLATLFIFPNLASAKKGKKSLGGREQREVNAVGVATNANGVAGNAQRIGQLFELADVLTEQVTTRLDDLDDQIAGLKASGGGLSGGSCVSDDHVGILLRAVSARDIAVSDPASVALAEQIYQNLNSAGVACDDRMRLNVIAFFQPNVSPDADNRLNEALGFKAPSDFESDLAVLFDFFGLPEVNPPVDANDAAAGDLVGGSCLSADEVETYRSARNDAGFGSHPFFVFVEDLFANLNQAGVVCDERMKLHVAIDGSPEPSEPFPYEFIVGSLTGDFETDLVRFFDWLISVQ